MTLLDELHRWGPRRPVNWKALALALGVIGAMLALGIVAGR